MAILNIVKEGDSVLRGKCREVTEITPRIITLLDDMAETLHDADGCGLAAPQVGVRRRIAL
ncbi:MAG: peptide deformylase, partial [Clostridia bacterium]|nr:peptide deformylase [Clostridia bacterium]